MLLDLIWVMLTMFLYTLPAVATFGLFHWKIEVTDKHAAGILGTFWPLTLPVGLGMWVARVFYQRVAR